MMRDPETDWVHRIDWVPDAGRMIEFRRGDEPVRVARVLQTAAYDTFRGIGDDRRLDPIDSTGVLLIPSLTYTHWRYLKDAQP